ncbi:MAG TPA: hypothetical protein VFU22_18665 [Roseiflexaceae bacterium]|nr:hypothetical protein [Roseiflexaceae bacterium]
MKLQRSIRGIALPVIATAVAIALACPLTLLFARAGLVQPPLFELSIGSIGITTQGETTYSSKHPIRTYYGVWIFAERRFLFKLARVEIPNDGRPIRWRGCRLAVRRSVIAECRPPGRR